MIGHKLKAQLNTTESLLNEVAVKFAAIEKQVHDTILSELRKIPDPGACDIVFGNYSSYLLLCEARGLASRAAWFSRERLIPAVLELEKQLSTQFHKGALFYDTGIAHLLAGNEDGYEYFLAMTDEEEFRKTSGGHKRGTMNLQSHPLSPPIIDNRMEFACNLLNGKVAGCAVDFSFMTGQAPITRLQLDNWRRAREERHQFELLRIIHDVQMFVGDGFPKYPQCADNPFVMLRLAKALTHLAQWVESCLTDWQTVKRDGLGKKLNDDEDFGVLLRNAAGDEKSFIGKCLDPDTELPKLLAELLAAPIGPQRGWRLLRILLIVRNSTAHTITPSLAMYQDRGILLNLLQLVFVSVFRICQMKTKQMP